MKQQQKALFTLDGIGTFEGFESGPSWNGWSCPDFPIQSTLQIIEALNNQKEQKAELVGNDVIVYDGYSETTQTFSKKTIRVDGEVIEVYPIGAFSWTWHKE